MNQRLNPQGLLLLKTGDEKREIEFEMAFLLSLNARQRFVLMERKSRELKVLLKRHGYGTSPSITIRK